MCLLCQLLLQPASQIQGRVVYVELKVSVKERTCIPDVSSPKHTETQIEDPCRPISVTYLTSHPARFAAMYSTARHTFDIRNEESLTKSEVLRLPLRDAKELPSVSKTVKLSGIPGAKVQG